MEIVRPLKTKKEIEAIKAALVRNRDKLLFALGINSALRVSDLLKLTVGDVRGKETLTIRETKTGKTKEFTLNQSIQKAVKAFVPADAKDTDYLFPQLRNKEKPMSRVQAYKVLNDAAQAAGIDGQIGTHTMRKTFAYHAYKAGVDLALLQKILNHSSQAETLRYIGIVQEDINAVYTAVNL